MTVRHFIHCLRHLEPGEFRQKLRHNFHELTHAQRQVYQVLLRPWWPARERFFFEACPSIAGQMYLEERKALYESIVDQKPETCFEIGTFTGGGSTYFLAEAFHALGRGKVVTMETNAGLHAKAKEDYASYLPHLTPHVEFVLGKSFDDLKAHINGSSIDAFFLDGAEDAQETVDQYRAFLPYIRPGTLLMAHDWHTEKAATVKPLIEAEPRWKKEREVRPPHSVGFVAYVYR